jgi:putative membrane protein
VTETPGRRTSPRILLVHTVTFRQARQFVPVLIPIVAATGFGGGRTTIILLAVAVTLLSLVTATLTWWRFSYADGPSAVVVTRGLLARSVRTVPTDRIRGVEVETPLLHRLFGLVRVRIDAAAGGTGGTEEELLVDGVPRAEGDRLRTAVLTHRAEPGAEPGADGAAPAEPPEEEFARFDNRWLLYAPLVGSYLAVPAAAAGASFRLLDELGRSVQPDLDGLELAGGWALAIGATAALLVLLAAGAVIGAALVNWGFSLVRRGGSLIAVRGLLTRRHTELEIDRIRGCTLSEGLGMRWVRAARVNALVTGLGDASRRGQLLPLGPRAEAWALARRLVEDPGPLIAHPPAARRRRIVRAVATGLLVTAVGAGAAVTQGWWWMLAAGVALTVLGVPVGLGRYASLGHVAGPRSFAVRGGWLVREQAVLQRRAVVGWRVRQSFFQRRAGLATVVACVGAGTGGYGAVDLAAADVAGFVVAASEPWATAFASR